MRLAVEQTVAAGYDLLEFSLHDAVNLDRRQDPGAVERQRTAGGLLARAGPRRRHLQRRPAGRRTRRRAAARVAEVTHDIGGTRPHRRALQRLRQGRAPADAGGPGQRRQRAAATWPPRPTPLGVTLGLEICNRYETNVVNTARDCLRLADDIGADNVMIHLDTYHMNIEEDDFVTPVREVRRPARLRPHRREPPRLPRLRAHRLRRRSSARWPRSTTAGRSPSSRSRRRSSHRACPTTSPSGATCGTTAPTWPPTRAASSTTACATRGRSSAHADDGARRAGPLADEAIALADDGPARCSASRAVPGAGKIDAGRVQLLAPHRRAQRRRAGWRMCRWTASTSPTPSCAGSARSTARARRTRSTRPATPTCWSGCAPRPTNRSTCRVSTATSSNRWPLRSSCCPTPGWSITEGNYLLLDDPLWARARARWTRVWFVAAEEQVRIERLVARHVEFGKSPSRRHGPGSPTSTSATPTWCRRRLATADRVIVNGAQRLGDFGVTVAMSARCTRVDDTMSECQSRS